MHNNNAQCNSMESHWNIILVFGDWALLFVKLLCSKNFRKVVFNSWFWGKKIYVSVFPVFITSGESILTFFFLRIWLSAQFCSMKCYLKTLINIGKAVIKSRARWGSSPRRDRRGVFPFFKFTAKYCWEQVSIVKYQNKHVTVKCCITWIQCHV